MDDEEDDGDHSEDIGGIHGEAGYSSCSENGSDESDNEGDDGIV